LTDAWEQPARDALRAAAGDIRSLVQRLQSLHDSLPVTPEETSLRDLDRDGDLPPAILIRAVIRNVLNDSLRPAAADLEAAAESQKDSR
jgi:hypothetical protein